MRNLYAGQEATVRTGHGTTDWFQIGKGVHQGCMLSPCLSFSDGSHLSFDEDNSNQQRRQNFGEKTNGLSESDWHVGDIVIHKTLGKGKVIELEGDGIIKVNFENHGIKSIMGNHPFVSKGE